MTAIVTMGFKSEAFVSGQGDIPMFPVAPTRGDYDALVEAVAGGISQSGHVLVVYPRWSTEPALQRLETVRVALNSRRLAFYGTDLPPLAGAVLASLASATAAYVQSPGALIAALPALERELVVLAWLYSVSGLDRPTPTVWQHMRSMSPKSAFGVSFWPEPSVKPLTKTDRAVPVPTTYRPMLLAMSARDGDTGWIHEVVAPALGSPPIKTYEPTPLGPRWWGTGRLVEAVAYPIDVPVTARRITKDLRPSLCRWCGEAIATAESASESGLELELCPFCGLDVSQVSISGGAA